MRYLAFDLGKSKYKHYNHVVDLLCNKDLARGAQALMPTGRADDAAVGYEPTLQLVEDTLLEPIDLYLGVSNARDSGSSSSSVSRIFALPIVQTRELFDNARDRNCIHIEADLNGHPDFKYKIDDHLGIWPSNPSAEVDRLLNALGLTDRRNTAYHVRSPDGSPLKVPSPTTLGSLFGHYLEVCASLSREHIASLVPFAPTLSARDQLINISRDKAAFAEYLAGNYVNFGRLLERTCNGSSTWQQLPLSLVIETLPAMQPRHYSISSSSVVSARKPSITAVVADTVLPRAGKRIPGLATNYLLAAHTEAHPRGLLYAPVPYALEPTQGTRLYAHMRKSAFILPALASIPVVMVGAGTGIAPFHAFVQERSRLKAMGRDVGSTKLFFGCRHPEQDFIYREEFSELEQRFGESFSMTVAFSRPTNGEEKRYVQDSISNEAESTSRLLIDENAYFSIYGSAAMARDVSDTVARIVMSRQQWTEGQMKEFAGRQK